MMHLKFINNYGLPLILQAALVILLLNSVSCQTSGVDPMIADWRNITAHPLLNWTQAQIDYFNSLVHKASFRNGTGPYCHTRVEFRLMSYEQFKNFTDAVRCVQNKRIDPTSSVTVYQQWVAYHRYAYSPSAHGGPCFLTWHAIYLLMFETALQECNPTVCITFCDFRAEFELLDICSTILLTDRYMGNGVGTVITGPFANYSVYPQDCAEPYGPLLTRACGTFLNLLNYGSYDDWDTQYNLFNKYADLCGPWNPNYENWHGNIHTILGGHLSSITCSPNDVIFWMIHGFIDMIFNYIRTKNSYPNITAGTYPTESNGYTGIPDYHHATDPASPFSGYTCQDGLQVAITHNIQYITVNNTCTTDSDCNRTPNHVSGFYCNSRGRCASKAKLGGLCSAGNDYECWNDPSCYTKVKCTGTCICVGRPF